MEPISDETISLSSYSEEEDKLYDVLNQNIKLEGLAAEFFSKLRGLGIARFEKRLGAGAAGTVVQLKGEEDALALKVFEYSKDHVFLAADPKGEAIALSLPSHAHLGNALGLFTYDGKHVNFTKTYNPAALNGQIIVGVLSRSLPGQTLSTLFAHRKTFSKQEIKQVSKQVVMAIRNLHAAGYTHKDIHAENILVHQTVGGINAHLIDFGIACPISSKRERVDWRKFGYLLAEMGGKQLLADPQFFDLLYSENRGVLNGKKPYSGKEIESHLFFKGL
ncbi:MAG: protein kinase family protein [Chlamydiia bacterium]|nr:protein kinase family protein [Chlamydiia bacterium]